MEPSISSFLFLLTTLLPFIHSTDVVRLRITDTRFERCPHLETSHSILSSNASSIKFKQTGVRTDALGVAKLTHLQLTGVDGRAQYISLPGCFRADIRARFERDIENPYIETFVNVGGGEKPCDKHSNNPYCPPSRNPGLRYNTQNQNTCRFCDLCLLAQEAAKEARQRRPTSKFQHGNDVCPVSGRRVRAGKEYPIRLSDICTPTKKELEQQLTERLGPNWRQYQDVIKRGSIVMTMHILDRDRRIPPICLRLGANRYQWNGPRPLWHAVRRRLERNCARYREDNVRRNGITDTYLGCYYGYINYVLE